jgi:dUTP pyrophosphatase
MSVTSEFPCDYHTLYIKIMDECLKDPFLLDYYTCLPNLIGDSGVDVCFPRDVEFGIETKLVGLGIECCMDYPGGYYLYPRSSIYKTPLRQSNSVGIIDRGYRGEIKCAIDSRSQYCIKRGDRFFQICAPDLKPIRVVLVDCLPPTERGDRGFGSTGQ